MATDYRIRKATVRDAKEIHSLINQFAKKEQLLPRSLNEIYENIRDHFVCEDGERVVGVCALHILWDDLAELRSLAVKMDAQKRGIGRALARRALSEAKRLGVKRVFVLTYNPEFFKTLGFKEIDKGELPQKIWGDCLRCHRFPECDEVALIRDLSLR